MKKVLFVSVLAMSFVLFNSCSLHKNVASKSSVNSSLFGQIGNVLIKDLGTTVLANSGMNNMIGKLNLGTKLNTILKGATMVNSFKNMLSGNYGIPINTVNNAYSSFGSLKDVIGFIGKNASPSFLSSLK